MTIEEQLAIVKDVLEKCEAATPGKWMLADDEMGGTSVLLPKGNAIRTSEPNAESIAALHNHAPAALEGWVRAVEFCNEPRDDNQFSDHPQERFNSGYAEACRDILALLATPKEKPMNEQPEFVDCCACGHVRDEHAPWGRECQVCDCVHFDWDPEATTPEESNDEQE